MIEIITLCGVSISMVVSGVNLFLNWYRAKDLPLKKHSKSVFIDRSISCFVKLVEYLKTHNITHDIANKLFVELLEKNISDSPHSMSDMISKEISNYMKIL